MMSNTAEPKARSIFLAKTGPMPRIIPDARYFSIPSSEVGADVLRNRALNCWPCVRSLVPVTGSGDPFACRNDCRMTDHGHQLPVAARFHPQDREAILFVVK